MENYSDYPMSAPTLESLGYYISVGTILWSDVKECLSSTPKENSHILLYSNNVKCGELIIGTAIDNDLAKGQFITPRTTINKSCILFPRTIQPDKLRYAFIQENDRYHFENHLLVITHESFQHLKLLYEYLSTDAGKKSFALFANSSQLSATELRSLPILGFPIPEFRHTILT